MTAPSASYSTEDSAPREGDQVAPARTGQRSARRCARCSAVGTHYLTCPALRLPPGYRLSEAAHPGEPPFTGRLGPGSRSAAGRSAAGRPGGGPDHPDWPCPPRPLGVCRSRQVIGSSAYLV
jgi:hypothetical protein